MIWWVSCPIGHEKLVLFTILVVIIKQEVGKMIVPKIQQDAHKFAYLVKAYPEKTAQQIIDLFFITKADVNAAIWAAVELGIITDVDPNTGYMGFKKAPKWDFGENVNAIEDTLTYAFQKLGVQEKDMEENYLAEWTQGYFPHDILIAIRHLLETDVLHEYELEDGENKHIFYTLKKNAGKNWGQKQFKTNPLTGEENAVDGKKNKIE
jgi:hypothetical protein